MIGKCLCSAVQFKITGDVPNLYQCHCSLCRKQSGAASNAATLVHKDKFSWKSGEDKITRYKMEDGFTSYFCSICGSPVPNPLRDTDKIWSPARGNCFSDSGSYLYKVKGILGEEIE